MEIRDSGIGGTEDKIDASEAILGVPNNRTLMVEKLTHNDPVKPELVKGLTNPKQVFEHFKPKVSMEFNDSEGKSSVEMLHFNEMKDFSKDGIINQSDLLSDLKEKNVEYMRMAKILKKNAILKRLLNDPDKLQTFIKALKALENELDENS